MPDELSDRELGTVIAALRHYQASGFGDMCKLPPELADIAVDGETNRVPLDDDEIDALCDRLNAGKAVTDEDLGEAFERTAMADRGVTFADLRGDGEEEQYQAVICPACHGLTPGCGRCRGMGTIEEVVVEEDDDGKTD